MDSDIQRLITDIYDTVPNPARWSSVLDQLARLVGSPTLVLIDAGGNAVSFRSGPDQTSPAPGDQIVVAWRQAARDDGAGSGDRPAIRFRRTGGRLDAGTQAQLDLILPHIGRALWLAQMLSRAADMARDLATTLDWLRIGVCVIRADRVIVAQNAAFRRQAATSRPIIVTPDGRLDFGRPQDRLWLRACLAQRSDPVGRMTCCPFDDTVPMSIHLAPLIQPGTADHAQADRYAVYCQDVAEQAQIDLSAVSRRLSLTGSESELIGLLADGLTNRQIAARRRRSVETVNSQVKSLLTKAQCGNRTQLIRRVTMLGGTILSDHPDG